MKKQFFRNYFTLLFFTIPITLLGQNTVFNIGHFGGVEDIDIDPSGQYLVSIGRAGKVKLWEAENYRLIRDLNQHTLYGSEVKFSPNGAFIYSFGGDAIIHKYSVEGGAILKSKKFKHGYGTSFDVSPNGKYVVTNASNKHDISIIDSKSFELIKSINGEVPFIYDLSFSADGKKLACIGNNRRVYIYDTQNWELIFTSKEYENTIELVDFHPDNIHLAINVYEKKIIIVNTQSKEEIFELKWPKKEGNVSYQPVEPINEEVFTYPDRILFSEDGKLLYGYRFHEIFVYDFSELKPIEKLKVTEGTAKKLVINDILNLDALRNRIYVGGYSSKGYYDLNDKMFVSLESNPLPISAIFFDKNDLSFTMYNEGKTIKKIDIKNGKPLGNQIFSKSNSSYNNLVFSKNRQFIFASKSNGLGHNRVIKDLKKEAYIVFPNSKMVSMLQDKGGFSNNSQYFAFASRAGVRFKKLDSNEKFGLIPSKSTKYWAFGKEGQSIFLSSHNDSIIREYDLETQNLIWEWNTEGTIKSIEASPDENYIAIISDVKASGFLQTRIILVNSNDKKVKKEWDVEGGNNLLWLTDSTFINFGTLAKAQLFNIKKERQIEIGNYFSAFKKRNYAIDPAGNHFALINANQKLVVYDLKVEKKLNFDTIKGIHFPSSIAFSNDGQFLLIIDSHIKAILFNLQAKKIMASYIFYKEENDLIFFAQNESNQISTNYKNNPKDLIYKMKNNKIYPILDKKLKTRNILK